MKKRIFGVFVLFVVSVFVIAISYLGILPVSQWYYNAAGRAESEESSSQYESNRFCRTGDEDPIVFGEALSEVEDTLFRNSRYLKGQSKKDLDFVSRVVVEEMFKLRGVAPQDIPDDVWRIRKEAFLGKELNVTFLDDFHEWFRNHSYYGELYERRSLGMVYRQRALYKDLAGVLFDYADSPYPEWADDAIDEWIRQKKTGEFSILNSLVEKFPEDKQIKVKDARKRRALYLDLTKAFFYQMQQGTVPVSAVRALEDIEVPFAWDFVDELVDYLRAQPGNEALLSTYSQRENMLRAAVEGLLRAIGDPFGWYEPPSVVAQEHFRQGINGFYTGFGFSFQSTEDGKIYFSRIIDGGAAKDAGLKIGDIVKAVDGKTLAGCSFFGISMGLKGEAGKGLTFTVFRPDTQETKDIYVERRVIRLLEVGSWPSVELADGRNTGDLVSYSFPLKDAQGGEHPEIAYIKIKSFARQVTLDIKEVLESEEFDWSKIEALIVDVRENGGGFSEAVSSFFLEPGMKIMEREDERGGRIPSFAPSGAFIFEEDVWRDIKFPLVPSEIPVVVLIDYGSASAAEVFAAALQENGRAVLIGGRTIGKGTSTGSFLLGKNGKYGQINMAHRFWYTPGGRHLESLRDKEGGGLAPDIPVTFSVEDKKKQARDPDYDPQIFTAIKQFKKAQEQKP